MLNHSTSSTHTPPSSQQTRLLQRLTQLSQAGQLRLDREECEALSLCPKPSFFRTWERVYEVTPSETFRDVLLRMEKLRIISSVETWLMMRDVRNRIAYEYLTNELNKIYQAIVGPAAEEMRSMLAAIDQKLRQSGI